MPPKPSQRFASPSEAAAIKVFARFRPFSNSEILKGAVDIPERSPTTRSVALPSKKLSPSSTEPSVAHSLPIFPFELSINTIRMKPQESTGKQPSAAVSLSRSTNKSFSYELCFSAVQGLEQRGSQEDVYAHVGPDLLSCVRGGFNATVLAYGQTGSGKTHTMMGRSVGRTTNENSQSPWMTGEDNSCSSRGPKQTPITRGVGGLVEPSLFTDRRRTATATGSGPPIESRQDMGVIPRFVQDAFNMVHRIELGEETEDTFSTTVSHPPSHSPKLEKLTSFRVTARYFEIYCEKAYDLLAHGNEVTVHDQGRVDQLTEEIVTSAETVLDLIEKGNQCRSVAATLKNDRSSRSHAIFQLIFQQDIVYSEPLPLSPFHHPHPQHQDPISSKNFSQRSFSVRQSQRFNFDGDPFPSAPLPPPPLTTVPPPRSLTSIINLVDLAGSERQKQSGAEGQQFKEMVNINQSLTTLRRVIQVLHDNAARATSSHTARPGGQSSSAATIKPPVRESILTLALSNSFGGNSKTVLLLALSPMADDIADTISTLEFGQIARKVVNKVSANEDPNSVLLRNMRMEIEALKKMLEDRTALEEERKKSSETAAIRQLQEVQHQPQASSFTGTRRDVAVSTESAEEDLDQRLADAQTRYTDLSDQILQQSQTNMYLMDQLKLKDDRILALQRQVSDLKKYFTRDVEQYIKTRPDMLSMMTSVKRPLSMTPGCPQCQATNIEAFAFSVKLAAVQEELHVLTESQEQCYLDHERLRKKFEGAVGQIADLRNQLNVVEDTQLVVQSQKDRIDELEQQVEHHLSERITLLMEAHRFKQQQHQPEEASPNTTTGKEQK